LVQKLYAVQYHRGLAHHRGSLRIKPSGSGKRGQLHFNLLRGLLMNVDSEISSGGMRRRGVAVDMELYELLSH
jgi:hypothetical protein